jgi:hypothetical protein
MAGRTESEKLRANPSKGRTELVWEGKRTQVELVPLEVRDKVKKWSDYIDYWAVDWDFASAGSAQDKEDTFHNQWQSYRTRKHSTLATESEWHN